MDRIRAHPSLLVAVAVGLLAVAVVTPGLSAQGRPVATPAPPAEMQALRAEIKLLRELLPGQAHVMVDVGQHFSGLWFAAQNRNWPLASFMLNETLSHLRWGVRVRPARKLASGQELQLAGILDGLEKGVLDRLKDAVEKQNPDEFQKAYRTTIEGCNSCHRAAEKPYLKVRVPARLGEPLDFKPAGGGV